MGGGDVTLCVHGLGVWCWNETNSTYIDDYLPPPSNNTLPTTTTHAIISTTPAPPEEDHYSNISLIVIAVCGSLILLFSIFILTWVTMCCQCGRDQNNENLVVKGDNIVVLFKMIPKNGFVHSDIIYHCPQIDSTYEEDKTLFMYKKIPVSYTRG
jgi:hypothetical protein